MFCFKQFTVEQSGSAMKVGTDGVLIGAWSSASEQSIRILDVGTGTGLIALMSAQRNPRATIDAIEIDGQSVVQARENIAESCWSNRIQIVESSIQEFVNVAKHKYDLIISNPPFFSNSLQCPDRARSVARHDNSLPMVDLMATAAKLLTDQGIFSIIIPTDQALKAIAVASEVGVFPLRTCDVYPTIKSQNPKRIMIEFTANKCANYEHKTLTIELESRMKYTDEYRALTTDFYLKF